MHRTSKLNNAEGVQQCEQWRLKRSAAGVFQLSIGSRNWYKFIRCSLQANINNHNYIVSGGQWSFQSGWGNARNAEPENVESSPDWRSRARARRKKAKKTESSNLDIQRQKCSGPKNQWHRSNAIEQAVRHWWANEELVNCSDRKKEKFQLLQKKQMYD